MARTFYVTQTNSDLSSDVTFNKAMGDSQETAGALTLTASQGGGLATGSSFTASGIPGTGGTSTGTFTIRTNITSSNSGINFRANLMRINSAGTVQATVLGSYAAASAGLRTQTFTNPALGTWAAGDRFRVQYQIQNTNAHGGDKGITFESGQEAQDTPFAAAPLSVAPSLLGGAQVFAPTVAGPKTSREFNGTSDYATNTSGSPKSAGPLTMVGWLRAPSAVTTSQDVFTLKNSASTNGYYIGLTSSGQLRVDEWGAWGGSNPIATTAATVAAATWTHFAGTYSGGATRSAFLDGANKVTNSQSVTGVNTGVVLAGRRNDGTAYFSGRLAHLAVYGVELSDAEIADLAAGALPTDVQAANLLAYWPLGGNDSPEPDDVGTLDLTLTGTTKGADGPPVGGVSVSPALLGPAVSFSPTVAPGAVAVAPALLGGAQVFAPSQISQAVVATLLGVAQLFAPVVAPGAVTAQPDLLGGAQVFAPSIEQAGGTQNVVPALIGPGALFAPSVQPGAVTVQPGLLGGATLSAPTVQPGAVAVSPARLGGVQVFAPAIRQSVAVPLLGGSQIFAPAVRRSVAVPLLGGAILFAPQANQRVAVPLLGGAVLFSPSLPGAGLLYDQPGITYNDPTLLYNGGKAVGPALLGGGQLFAPLVLGSQLVHPPLLGGAILYSPALPVLGVAILSDEAATAALLVDVAHQAIVLDEAYYLAIVSDIL